MSGIQIPLNRGQVALIDEKDLLLVSGHKWYGDRYVVAHTYVDGRRTVLYMHRLILGARKGEHVDHVNGDRFDNRRANIRLCTGSQNEQNRGAHRNSVSRFKGVSPSAGKWRSDIGIGGKQVYLGRFSTEAEAAAAYNRAALRLHDLEFLRLNEVQ